MSKRSLAKRTTIADIAARAGVSKSTVSHALSGKRPISAATQRRIRAVIEEVGYRPNVVAQRLAGGGHARNVGLVFPLSAMLIAGTETEFIVNAANAANAADYTFLLLTHLEGNTTQFQRVVASGLVDGFILMQVHMQDPRVELLRQEQIPFVLLGRCADNAGLSFVDVAIETGVADAVARLAAAGHRTVGYLSLVDDGDFGFAVRALNTFRHHCALHGVTPVVKPAKPTLEGAEAAFHELLQEAPAVSALLVRNKTVATGIGRAAAKAGRHIPDDLAVVGMGSADNQLVLLQGRALSHLDRYSPKRWP
ncbi:MAG: LacI family DNA-binding transcriptional regulator [Caldilineaceae bacterium]